jgi:cation-transporting P-type ATPase E
VTAVAAATRPEGLSEQEARRRLRERPAPRRQTSRSYWSIVRANVFTIFNLILLVLGVLTLAFGEWQDALFLGVLIANSGIGIAQEVRAKNTLDRLAALVAPTALVVRDGTARRLRVEEVVTGDLVRVQSGDQVVADGRLDRSDGLLVDESILTGESEPVARAAGDEVRSGSFAVEGSGEYVVTAVGDDSYAAKVAGEARMFRHPRSPLERSLNLLLIVLTCVLVPLGLTLGYELWRRNTPIDTAVPTTVAAVVTLVPEGLILLTSLTYAVAAMRMARRGALAQQLNAVESLAAVDVVCFDKTGTLTEPGLRVVRVVPSDGTTEAELKDALSRYAASAPAANATLAAIGEEWPAEPEPVREQVPFSSKRRWSALRLGSTGYVLGAPELFGAADEASGEAHQGRRVLALATTHGALEPDGSKLEGLVVLAERLRPEARDTVEFFRSQGVALRVLSGDRTETVAAIARDAGIPLDDGTVIGRCSPDEKREIIRDLTAKGHYVAMVGDGVNDVPALKAARLAIAQGSGAQMAKSVADLVLVRGEFAAVPALVAEGRKVFRNLQRVAKLFVTKSAFAVFLILSIGLTPTAYPLLPRHLTLAATLTIGVPSFFLALGPSEGRLVTGNFLKDIARFAVPAGTAAGLGVLASYLFALNVVRLPLVEARTIATSVLVLVGLYLIIALEAAGRVRSAAVSTLCATLLGVYLLVLAIPSTRSFFALDVPGLGGWLIVILGAAIAIAGLWLTDDRFIPGKTTRGSDATEAE